MESKLKHCFSILLIGLLIFSTSLTASQLATGTQDTVQYMDELSLIQNQIFSLALKIVFQDHHTPEDEATINTGFKSLDQSLNKLYTRINNELLASHKDAQDTRALRLVLNALNYMQNALYELESIYECTNDTDKLLMLQRYFNFRVYAENTLKFVKDLLPS